MSSTISTPSTLHAFLIFNPTLGEEATEARKILFFHDNRANAGVENEESLSTGATQRRGSSTASIDGSSIHRPSASSSPSSIDINYAKDLCGIAEGLIAFSRDFSPSALADSVHCDERRYAFYQPEPDYWMVLVVNNPTVTTREKNGAVHTVYQEDDIDDSVLQAILRRCYCLFTLFNGRFDTLCHTHSDASSPHASSTAPAPSTPPSSRSCDTLRAHLSLFMSYFLPSLRFSSLPFFTDIHGFHFMPIDKISFLTVQYIINLIQHQFTHNTTIQTNNKSNSSGTGDRVTIHGASLMYGGKLIYSGIAAELMFLLYSLDQQSMYSFLVEYLALKEKFHEDIDTYWKECQKKKTTKEKEEKDAAAAAKTGADDATSPGWTPLPRPPRFAHLSYNLAESLWECEGRQAEDRKRFDKAQNKGLIPMEMEFPQPKEDDDADDREASSTMQTGNNISLQGAVGAGEDGAAGNESGPGSRSQSNASASAAPFGFMTGPYRISATPPTVPGSNTSAAIPMPGSVGYVPPCAHSPRIYPHACANVSITGAATAHQPNHPTFYPTYEEAAAATAAAAGSSDASSTSSIIHPPVASSSSTSLSSSSSPRRPLRLVVYQKYRITLFLIVECEGENENESEKQEGAGSESATEQAATEMNNMQLKDSIVATESSSSSDSLSTSTQPSFPPHSFYTALENFMDSNLHKLGDMLYEQSVRINTAAAGGSGSGSSGGPSASQSVVEEPYRFLYFNHMNLALKTSLASGGAGAAGSGGSSKNAPAGSALTMDTIKIIRAIHRDFNTKRFKFKQIAAYTQKAATMNDATVTVNATTPSADTAIPSHLRHNLREEGSNEVIVKTKHGGWIVGRRATQSHREFFLLLDERTTSMQEVQEEVDNLSRTYFYNIFIH